MIPIVMLTGMSDFDSKLAALDAGADDFLNKPYNHIELLTRLRALLRNAAVEFASFAPAVLLSRDRLGTAEVYHKFLLQSSPIFPDRCSRPTQSL